MSELEDVEIVTSDGSAHALIQWPPLKSGGNMPNTFRERFEARTGCPWPVKHIGDPANVASILNQLADEMDELRRRVLPEDMERE